MPTKSKGKTAFLPKKNWKLSDPPEPFTLAPQHLTPFTSKLSKGHVYITSIDNTPWQFKAKIFAIPFLTNAVILGFLLWRVWVITPYYFYTLVSMMGSSNDFSLANSLSGVDMAYEVMRRALNLIFDLMLYTILWPWPRAFFGPSTDENPMAWRFSIGFSDQEITVRRSRQWDESLGDVVTEGGESTEGGSLFLANVRKATSRVFMHEKTGYSLLDGNWDLDWRLMILSTMMVDKKEISIDNLKTTVLVHSEQFGWVLFDAQNDKGTSKEEEGRRKILAFKDELTAMGKENLFFRWIELIQFESSQPGGFGPGRQDETMRKAKAMFEEQGVDFEKFWGKIGGMEGMPGMERANL